MKYRKGDIVMIDGVRMEAVTDTTFIPAKEAPRRRLSQQEVNVLLAEAVEQALKIALDVNSDSYHPNKESRLLRAARVLVEEIRQAGQ